MDTDLVAALRSRGVEVITPADAGLIGKTDDEQLAFATERECVLYTFNVGDFFRLHAEWITAGREHSGMILAQQHRLSVGEQLRRILRLRASVTKEAMQNAVELLVIGADDRLPCGKIVADVYPASRKRLPTYRAVTLISRSPRKPNLPNSAAGLSLGRTSNSIPSAFFTVIRLGRISIRM